MYVNYATAIQSLPASLLLLTVWHMDVREWLLGPFINSGYMGVFGTGSIYNITINMISSYTRISLNCCILGTQLFNWDPLFKGTHVISIQVCCESLSHAIVSELVKLMNTPWMIVVSSKVFYIATNCSL